METFYADYKAPATPVRPKEDDYKEIMKKLTKLPKKDFGDQFEGSNLTPFFTALVGDEVVSKLREEFVSWTDVRVGTLREMLDIGISAGTAVQIKTTLNAIYRTTSNGNIESMSIEDLMGLEVTEEDVVS